MKYDVRMPAARKFIEDAELNEFVDGVHQDVGLIVQGGLYNSTIRALADGRPGRHVRAYRRAPAGAQRGLSAGAGRDQPLLRRQARACWSSRRASPNSSSRRLRPCCAARTCRPGCTARTSLRWAASTRRMCCSRGCSGFSASTCRRSTSAGGRALRRGRLGAAARGGRPSRRAGARAAARTSAPGVRSGRCSPRSSWWSASVGKLHISADIGCHALATFEPFSFGNSILGYGMSMASERGRQEFLGEAPGRDHGRRRLLAQRPPFGRFVHPAEQRRRRPGHHEERLHVRDRHPGDRLDAGVARPSVLPRVPAPPAAR